MGKGGGGGGGSPSLNIPKSCVRSDYSPSPDTADLEREGGLPRGCEVRNRRGVGGGVNG